ncbi:hypothetical protein RIF29_19144 [Crotalaria pallida]|uniref:Uncharacterized protein n=1 Tax=Crotalaria pallida TaxID=3830 RepID=A0AAN9I7H3_CROPI
MHAPGAPVQVTDALMLNSGASGADLWCNTLVHLVLTHGAWTLLSGTLNEEFPTVPSAKDDHTPPDGV